MSRLRHSFACAVRFMSRKRAFASGENPNAHGQRPNVTVSVESSAVEFWGREARRAGRCLQGHQFFVFRDMMRCAKINELEIQHTSLVNDKIFCLDIQMGNSMTPFRPQHVVSRTRRGSRSPQDSQIGLLLGCTY